MKIALLSLLGLLLGALGGAAFGIGAGIVWTEVFNISKLEGYGGMLVFFTFMPLAALRWHDAASTRSPSTSTMQARQLPSAR